MRFEPSPLSLSISLQALAAKGERKHFGVFQSGSVYCKSFRWMLEVRGSRYGQFMYCTVWNRAPKTLKSEVTAREVFGGRTESWWCS